jgi:hypothetical protein
MEHSTWEPNSCSDSYEICFIVGTQRFITMFTRSCLWSLSWDESSPYHRNLFPKICFNIILPSTSRSSEWSLSYENRACIPHLSHVCYMPCPSHPPAVYHSSYIWWRVQVVKLLMQFSPTSSRMSWLSFFGAWQETGLLALRPPAGGSAWGPRWLFFHCPEVAAVLCFILLCRRRTPSRVVLV